MGLEHEWILISVLGSWNKFLHDTKGWWMQIFLLHRESVPQPLHCFFFFFPTPSLFKGQLYFYTYKKCVCGSLIFKMIINIPESILTILVIVFYLLSLFFVPTDRNARRMQGVIHESTIMVEVFKISLSEMVRYNR